MSSIVIDNGSGLCKMGYGGEDTPRRIIPCIVGKESTRNRIISMGGYNIYIGEEILQKRHILDLIHPMQGGIVTNWDAMEKIWNHAFSRELKVAPEENILLITEDPLNTMTNREEMVKIMFESFRVPQLAIRNPLHLSLLASGMDQGIVMDMGEGNVHASVFNGNEQFSTDLGLGGRDLTNFLMNSMNLQDLDMVTANEIKQDVCKVLMPSQKEREDEIEYFLPDQRKITIGKSRFTCPELLFSGNNGSNKGIQEMIMECCQSVKFVIEKDIDLILTGGTSKMFGLKERLMSEISSSPIVFKETKKDPILTPWIGGSMVASLSNQECITREEYDEFGSSICRRVVLA